MSTHQAEVNPRPRTSLRTVDELAADLRVSRWTVYKLVRDGHLRAVHVGERLRFRDEDVERYLEGDLPP